LLCRHRRRRGAMGTGRADREGVESRKDPALGMAEGFEPPAGNSPLGVIGEHKGPPRDRRPRRASHGECVVTQRFLGELQERLAAFSLAVALDKTAMLRSLPHACVDDSRWEPNGVTLPVRFCEGPGTTGGSCAISPAGMNSPSWRGCRRVAC
jgi:hypothetical protein